MVVYSYKTPEIYSHRPHPYSLTVVADIAEPALMAAREHEVIIKGFKKKT